MSRRSPPIADENLSSDRQRLDKWLVYARFAKTRSVAASLVENGRVRINGTRINKPDRDVKIGDVLTLALPHVTTAVRVTSVAERRGSYDASQDLYEILPA